MKRNLLKLSNLAFAVLPATALMFCSWDSPGVYNYPNRVMNNSNNAIACNTTQTDTLPKADQENVNKAMKDLDIHMDKLNEQLKNIDINLDMKLDALSKIDIESIQKQTEASLKQIEWDKIQQDVNVSLKNVQDQIAKIDLSKMKVEMQGLQDKLQSEAFKSQFNAEKMQKQINESMERAKAGMEKANRELQQMKTFTDALAADGLIDKKKGYEIEWKSGELYINGQKQPKDISDKYRRYESTGGIKVLPEGAEHF